MNPGDKITINGVELLILDIINGKPFAIALNTNIQSKFDEESNNYNNSELEYVINQWLDQVKIPTIPHSLNLMTLDGCGNYEKKDVKAAPLTLGEYQAYSSLIVPNITEWFWLATGWTARSHDNTNVLRVFSSGIVEIGNIKDETVGAAPAMLLDASDLGMISTEDLLAELKRRIPSKENFVF